MITIIIIDAIGKGSMKKKLLWKLLLFNYSSQYIYNEMDFVEFHMSTFFFNNYTRMTGLDSFLHNRKVSAKA